MKNVTVLGATGSIGKNALEIISNNRDKYTLCGISGYSNMKLLIEQIKKFSPKYICVGKEEDCARLKSLFPDKTIFFGDNGLKEMGKLEETDILLTAVSGAIGIEATVEAIKKEKRIALANKETMVAAGEYINNLLKKYPKAEIIPVDSEHSAIFQSMQSGKKDEVRKLIITASGGTFRGKKREELKDVTVEQALKHPNWSMGKKITIDSSTLINKGLEVIEAHMLFGIDYDKIEVVVHPQSIIHSMVEFKDSSIVAQLGVPDMKLPIHYALSYPNRIESSILERLNIQKLSSLTFEPVDNQTFKGIDLAIKAGKIGKSMPCVFNSANEVAVELFLNGKIKFLEIYEIIENAMNCIETTEIKDVDTIKKIDNFTRKWVYENYGK